MINSITYEEDGIMVVVMPHGILLRGASEGIIRQRIIENNLIDTIIGSKILI